jgi:3-isopropylmalate/(R)-2-methylmalate dehydratase small subunit
VTETFRFEGSVHVYGDNVDTDVIIPARYLTVSEPEELAKRCLEDLDPDFASRVRAGDLIVAGRNFGSGSSREHAALAIKGAGVACVVADSFARIFYRNAINVGLPIVECPGVAAGATTGDRFFVDLGTGIVENRSRGERHEARPLPAFMQEILGSGGLMPWVKRSLGEGGRVEVTVPEGEPAQADWRLD